MLFRILTVTLIILSGMFFLINSQRPDTPAKIAMLTDTVMLDLLEEKQRVTANFRTRKWKRFYSENLEIKIIYPEGILNVENYNGLMSMIDFYAEHGQAYDLQVTNQAVMVFDNGQRAVVQRESIESWLFKDRFDDVPNILIETQHWVLEDNNPRIIRLTKEYGSSNTFNQPYRETMPVKPEVTGV